MGDPGRIQTYRHQVWLRPWALRCLRGAYRWQARVFVPDAGVECCRQGSDDDRGAFAGLLASRAESLAGREGAAVRLLSVRPDHERGRSVEADSAPESRGDPRPDERAYLPLRHLPAHFTRHRARIAGGLSHEPNVLP